MGILKRAGLALVATGLMLLPSGGVLAADLDGPASIIFDQYRVPTIVAETEHDAIYLQGYMHAQDRFFQMDFQRRQFSGTLSELVGTAAIPTDVQLRTLGLGRAAERSLPLQTPETMAWLEAYAAGVNAYIFDETKPLPLEYSFLELDRGGIPPWTPLDSLKMTKGLAFGLSFDLGDIDRTLAFLAFRAVLGDTAGLQLLNLDLYRTAPFDPGISIPPSTASAEGTMPDPPADEELPSYFNDPNFETLVRDYRDNVAQVPLLAGTLQPNWAEQGSNWWVVAGSRTESGYPMLTNDPHLALDQPATFYEIHLVVNGGINVTGVSFPGAPGIVQGCNQTVCWGSTVNPLDVTDAYQEVLLTLDPAMPTTPTHTFHNGAPERMLIIPQQFNFNVIGDGVPNNLLNAGVPADQGGATFIVPRRNNGPIVQTIFDPTSPTPLTGISVQYVGWSGTRELECFRQFTRAESMQDFKDALQFFDVGSQNWSYADINGNIAYYTSGELPLRFDLQNFLFPAGLNPPSLIRDGTGTNPHEWQPLAALQPGQALPFEILPFAEMPQIENPPQGYILNANNDPIGTSLDNVSWNQFRAGFNGALYLSEGYAQGFRMGRIQRLMDDIFANGGKLSVAESIAVQANNQLLDAEVFVPYIVDALNNASNVDADPLLAGLGANPAVIEAVGRLANWDFSTPTGIIEGFDPGDNPFAPVPPGQAEIDASVAATIYATWRGQVTQRVIDTTLNAIPFPLGQYAPGSGQAMSALRNLLDNSSTNGGTGASLINFFTVPGVADAFDARDIILLNAVANSLNLLASNEFAPAFANSTNQEDYRWGKLHRIVFDSALDPALSIPPAGSPQNLAPDLPGFARAGGFGAVDASAHSARADGLNEFMFGSGANRRVVATMTPDGPEVLEVIPGGQSGAPGSPQQVDQLFLWLVNAFHPLPLTLDDVNALATDTLTITCGDGVIGPGEQCDDGNMDGNDGCSACMFAPVITCDATSVSADAETCTTTLDCDAVASCNDVDGSPLPVTCGATGPFGLGVSPISVQCAGATMMTATACSVEVVDTTAPVVEIELVPAELWPPNHRMIDVDALVTVVDACGGDNVVTLESIISDEPDDAPGDSDGSTVNDIQGAELGTYDREFQLRAERDERETGRTYTVRYAATDARGNSTTAFGSAVVDHTRLGVSEPLTLRVSNSGAGTLVEWTDASNMGNYNVIRGTLSELQVSNGVMINLGEVNCIESASTDTSTIGQEDLVDPAPGEVFFYAVEYVGSQRSSYGTVTAPKPRVVSAGDCM